MKDNKFIYIMSFLLIVTLFVSLSVTYFVVEKSNQGVSNVSSQYFDIVFSDPIIKILLIALGIKTIFLIRDFDWYETVGIVLAILIAS